MKIVKIADIVDLAVKQTVEVTCKVGKVKGMKIVKKKSGDIKKGT